METILVVPEAPHLVFCTGYCCTSARKKSGELTVMLRMFQGALAVAVLNIQIPHIVGSVIDVLAKFSSVKDKEAFFREMKMPALKLIFVYLAQVPKLCLI